MKKRWAIALAVVMAAALGLAGCKRGGLSTVDAGEFQVKMPGSPVKNTQPLPIDLADFGISGTLTMTMMEATENGQTYVAVHVSWGEALNAIKANKGEGWDVQSFYDRVTQNIVALLTMDAQVGQAQELEISGVKGLAYDVTIDQKTDAETGEVILMAQKGKYAVYQDEVQVLVMMYIAQQSQYSEANQNRYMQSLQLNQGTATPPQSTEPVQTDQAAPAQTADAPAQ